MSWFGKGSPAVPAVQEDEEGVAVREEGHMGELLHDQSEDQVVEERGDLHKLSNGELLLLLKQLIIIKHAMATGRGGGMETKEG